MKKQKRWFGLGPIAWLWCWGFYSWACNQIHPQHPDVAHVNARRAHYADLLDGLTPPGAR
jgi:hypothetical protein